MADMNVHSPGAAFARQAKMEAQVEAALRWALRLFLADVEAFARRDGTYLSPADVAGAWALRMGAESLRTRLPNDVADYVAGVQAMADTPEQAYDTAMAVTTASAQRAWSVSLTDDVLTLALSPETPSFVLTAAGSASTAKSRTAKANAAARKREQTAARSATVQAGKPSPSPPPPPGKSKRALQVESAFDQALGSTGNRSWYDTAKRDARTAVTGLDGIRSVAEMSRLGVASKMWVAHHDDRVRASHAEADGQVVPVDGHFSVGGYPMTHPGDRSAPPGETINCRCITVAAP